MKIFTFLLFSSIISTTAYSQEPKSVPEEFKSLLDFDERTIDLGKIKDGEIKQGRFDYQNVSEEEVRIEFISVCECTEVEYSKESLAPGERASIEFTFDSSKRKDDERVIVDILLTNIEPSTGYQVVEQVYYTFEVIQ